jgi:hypothetical protein
MAILEEGKRLSPQEKLVAQIAPDLVAQFDRNIHTKMRTI